MVAMAIDDHVKDGLDPQEARRRSHGRPRGRRADASNSIAMHGACPGSKCFCRMSATRPGPWARTRRSRWSPSSRFVWGIGANTAIFSVVSGVLLKPLPYANGDRLVLVRQSTPKVGRSDVGVVDSGAVRTIASRVKISITWSSITR